MHRDPIQPIRASGPSRSPRARGRDLLRAAMVASAVIALGAPTARAEGRLQKLRGHLGIGYAKLLGSETPAGSFSMGAGVDYPVTGSLRAGVALGYHLLGGRIFERGSFVSSVDYSMVELLALAHWAPTRLGPLGRISVGPGLFGARGDLSVQAGGASFSDLAVDEVAPGFALDGTLMQRRESPVRIGLESGIRVVFLSNDTWTMALIRLAFHY